VRYENVTYCWKKNSMQDNPDAYSTLVGFYTFQNCFQFPAITVSNMYDTMTCKDSK